MRQLELFLLHVLQQHQPHRRHAGGVGHLLGVHQLVDRGAVELGARHHQLGAHRRRREGDAPAVGVEQRHHRQHHVLGGGAERVAIVGDQRVQHVGAVRIQHALRVARGARGVAHRRGGVLVEHLPLEVAVGFRDPVLIGDRVLQRGLRHMRLVGEDDVALDARQLRGDLFQHRHEGEVDHHHAVFGVVDDPGDLLGKQPRVDGMADRADTHDAVPRFEVPPRVPGDGGDPVPELDAVAVEPLRHFQRALPYFGVSRAVNGSFDRAGDHLAFTVDHRRMVDDPMTQHRPVLHQAAHQNVPPVFYPGGIVDDISAKTRRSKWACGRVRRGAPSMVTVAAVLLAFFSQHAWARSAVPLPKPRPAEAPALIEPAPAEAEPADEEPAPPADAPAAESKIAAAFRVPESADRCRSRSRRRFPTSRAKAVAAARIWCGWKRWCCRIKPASR